MNLTRYDIGSMQEERGNNGEYWEFWSEMFSCFKIKSILLFLLYFISYTNININQWFFTNKLNWNISVYESKF